MTDDVDAMVEAVLDVLAPKVDGPPGYAAARWPQVCLDYEGRMVMPSDEQLRGMAEQIVTAIRTAAVPAAPVWQQAGVGEERPVGGGLTGRIEPSYRDNGQWNWMILDRTVQSGAVQVVGYALGPAAAKAEVAAWERDIITKGTDNDR